MKQPQWWLELRGRADQFRDRFAALQRREQKMLVVAAVVIALALVYLCVWEPIAGARARNANALADARLTAVQIEHLATLQKAQGTTASAPANSSRSLLTVVDQASRSDSGIGAPARLQPDGDTKVRIWFEGAPFNGLVDWLQVIDTRYGIVVKSADITHKDKPGKVDAHFTLERSQ